MGSILKGQPHDSLCEGVPIPFCKPDLSSSKPYLVLVGTQNTIDLGMKWTPDVEFPLDDRTRREVNLFRLWTRHTVFILVIDRQAVLC
jgi:hypothetical protein